VVVGVAAPTSNERIVFLAKDALTDAKFDGSHRISVSQVLIFWVSRCDFWPYCSGSQGSANGL
jgi:hypothetical protein